MIQYFYTKPISYVCSGSKQELVVLTRERLQILRNLIIILYVYHMHIYTVGSSEFCMSSFPLSMCAHY